MREKCSKSIKQTRLQRKWKQTELDGMVVVKAKRNNAFVLREEAIKALIKRKGISDGIIMVTLKAKFRNTRIQRRLML